MKIEIKKLVYSALFATTLFLVGCADAGSDQVVTGSSLVTLDANNSTACVGGEIKKYKWKQMSGTHVDIDNNTNSRITFTAPSVETETVLEFRLKTVEKGGHPRHFRSYDWVKVTVQPRDTNDTTAPRITLAGDNPMTLHVGETYVEPGATAIDAVDGNVDVNITGEVNTSTAGRYTVTYTATDSANNVAIAERNVTVIDSEDTTPPVIILVGDNPMTLHVGETYVEPGATAIDDVDGDINITSTGNVDTNNTGTYIITYTAIDSANNVATSERNVTVINGEDTTAPIITLRGEDNITLKVGDTYIEAGATAVDDVDGDINVTITGEVDTSTVGTYIVTYTATDSANNVATAQRIVIVTANTTGIKSISNNVSTEEGEATYNVEMYAASTEQTYAITITTRDGETVISTPIFTAGVMYDGTQSTITVPVAVENFSLTLPILEDNISNTVSDPFIITIGGVSNPPIEEGVHDIDLTADWTLPENALFLDIREDWERVESRPVGAIGGAVYGTRNFVDSVLSLAENDKSKQIILICHSGSRTEEAVQILSNEGFSNVWQIVGGMIQWTAVKPDEILSGPL